MKGSSIKYLISEGFRNVSNNKLMSLASIGVLTACLLMVGFAVLLTENMNSIVGYVGEQSTVAVFIKDGSSQDDVDNLIELFNSNFSVKNVNYISKEQAYINYASQLGNDAAIKTLEEDNILPASINIYIKDMSRIDDIVSVANDSSIVESVTAPTNIANTIKDLNSAIGWFGFSIVISLILVSLIIISNTIRATVFARRREIGIMKQVGATNNFVRLPFLIEGMVIGLISAICAFILTFVGYEAVVKILTGNTSLFLKSMFTSLVPFWNIGWILAVGFLFGGILAGAIGSLISLRKHLSV